MKFFLIAVALMPWACQTADEVAVVKDDPYSQITEPEAVHGFTLFGKDTIYASHQSRFGGSFSYQVILEISMIHNDQVPDSLYSLDGPRTNSPSYSLKPEPFALQELLTLDKKLPVRTTFRASLYRGAFWKGGTPVLHNIHVKVRRLIFQNRFGENGKSLPYLMYYTFGNDKELFAAHLINDYPDFDHVVKINLEEGVMTKKESKELKNGKLLVFTKLMNAFPNALENGESIQVKAQIGDQYKRLTGKVLEQVHYDVLKLY
jgi:hypothetical protein